MGITAPSNTDGFTVGQVCPGGNCSQKTGSAVILSTTDGGVPAPTLDPLSPSSGTAAGANPVTLTGSGFGTTAGATSVSFGGTDASSVSCASPTSCTAKVPPAPSGATLPDTVEVAVTVGGLTSNWTAYTYLVASPAPGSTFTPITPYRVCDTRSGNPSGLVAAGTDLAQCEGKTLGAPNPSTLTIPIASTYADTVSSGPHTTDGVPAGATAVVLNVTAINPSSGGYLTVWPAGVAQPVVSNLNFTRGEVVANSVIVPVSSSGKVSVYNSSGTTNIAVDVAGYFSTTGATFTGTTPYRACDTRTISAVGYATPCSGTTLGTTGKTMTLSVAGVGPVPADATAVVLNVTAVGPSVGGYLTVWPTGGTQPIVSNLNFTPRDTVANAVTVGLGTSGKISLAVSGGTTNVIVDVVGWYS